MGILEEIYNIIISKKPEAYQKQNENGDPGSNLSGVVGSAGDKGLFLYILPCFWPISFPCNSRTEVVS